MLIKEISVEEYRDFIEKDKIGYNFMQAPEFATIHERFILGGFQNGKLTHATIVEPRKAMKLFKYAYTAQDYLSLKRENDGEFVEGVKEWLKSKGYILWQMESSIEDRYYDAAGNIVEGGFDNTSYIPLYEAAGFNYQNLGRGTSIAHQVTWQSVLDLKDIDTKGFFPNNDESVKARVYDEILKNMSGNKRRAIQSASRKGVEVKLLQPKNMSDEEWNDFERLLDLAGELHHFDSGELSTHKALALAYGDTALIAMAYIEEEGRKVAIATGMFVETNSEMIYYISGSDRKYSKFNAPEVIQGAMIKKAAEDGMVRYNFGGISGYFNKGEEGYGLYFFKKEFGGRVIHTLGVFNMPLNAAGKVFMNRLR